jgi:peptidoglycan pentaglycine glycine transferase (the first glycine)
MDVARCGHGREHRRCSREIDRGARIAHRESTGAESGNAMRATAAGFALGHRHSPEALPVRSVTDAREWDDLVAALPCSDMRVGWEWGEMRAEQGWRTERLAFVEDGHATGACALQSRTVRHVGTILYTPRGPLFASTRALGALLAAIHARARQTGAVFLRISPAIPADDAGTLARLAEHGFMALPESWTPWNAPRYVQVLDIRASETVLLQGMRRRYRQYIANVGHKGLRIAPGHEEDVPAFHDLMVSLSRLKHFPVRELGYYRALYRRYAARGQAVLLLARAHDDAVGGLLGFRFGDRAYIHYSSVRSSLPDSLRHGVAPALFWEFIRRARAASCVEVDFGSSGVTGPPDADHPNHGVYDFKTGLGARLHAYVPYHDLVFRRVAYAAFRFGEMRGVPVLFRLMARMPAVTRLLRRFV